MKLHRFPLFLCYVVNNKYYTSLYFGNRNGLAFKIVIEIKYVVDNRVGSSKVQKLKNFKHEEILEYIFFQKCNF